jgi:HEAT repeat protein
LLLSVFVTGTTLGILALFSAMGHGSLEWREAWPVGMVLMGLGMAGAAVAMIRLERWTFGPPSTRPANALLRPAVTRSLTVVFFIGTLVLGPWLREEYEFQSNLRRARRSEDDEARREAIRELGSSGDARALPVIESIATTPVPSEPGDAASSAYGDRFVAITALRGVPGGHEVLLEIAASLDARVRAEAGGTLVQFAREPQVWSAIEGLLASDPEASVRMAMTEALAVSYYQLPPDRKAAALSLLRSRLTDADPRVRLRAAMRLGLELKDRSGYDATLAIALDPAMTNEVRWEAMRTLKLMGGARTVPPFAEILTGESEPGFIPLDEQDRYRELAAEAMGGPPAYAHERAALVDMGDVLRAQFRYREENGFFDGKLDCLETPSECLPRYPRRDEILLRPVLVALTPKNGYLRRFIPGPAAAPEEIRRADASPTSVESWAYVAFPVRPGETGIRGFCGDSTGRICFTADGSL